MLADASGLSTHTATSADPCSAGTWIFPPEETAAGCRSLLDERVALLHIVLRRRRVRVVVPASDGSSSRFP